MLAMPKPRLRNAKRDSSLRNHDRLTYFIPIVTSHLRAISVQSEARYGREVDTVLVLWIDGLASPKPTPLSYTAATVSVSSAARAFM